MREFAASRHFLHFQNSQLLHFLHLRHSRHYGSQGNLGALCKLLETRKHINSDCKSGVFALLTTKHVMRHASCVTHHLLATPPRPFLFLFLFLLFPLPFLLFSSLLYFLLAGRKGKPLHGFPEVGGRTYCPSLLPPFRPCHPLPHLHTYRLLSSSASWRSLQFLQLPCFFGQLVTFWSEENTSFTGGRIPLC